MTSESKWPFWTVTTVIVALVGIVAPIIWDLYKGRSSLEIQLISTASLVSKTEEVKNLRILYGDREISQLTRATFLLVNSGKHPIRDTEIVENATIKFSGNSEILEVVVEKLEPANLKVSMNSSPGEKSVRIAFPLLNPGDVAQFSVLINGLLVEVSADARISGVKQLKFIDRRAELAGRQDSLGWVFWSVSFFTLFFLIAELSSIKDYSKSKQKKRFFTQIRSTQEWPDEKAKFLERIQEEIALFFPQNDGEDSVNSMMKVFRDFVENQEGDTVPSSAKSAVRSDIEKRLDKTLKKDRSGAIAGIIFCTIGLIYIIYKLEKVFMISRAMAAMLS